MAKRIPGFYWTRHQTGRWVPSEWTGKVWRGMSTDHGGTVATKDDEFLEIGGHIPTPQDPDPDGHVGTVGELKAVLANEADDLPLAWRGYLGRTWINGFSIGHLTLCTLGRDQHTLTMSTDNSYVETYKGTKGKPFAAIGVG